MVNNELFPYKIDTLSSKNGVEYVACKNAALIHIQSLDQLIDNEMKHPAKMNGFIIVVCAEGDVTLSAHLKDYVLTKNSVLVAPTSVLVFKECHNCELYIAAFNNDFAVDMNIDLKMIMPIVSSIHSQCIVRNFSDKSVMLDVINKSFASIYREYVGSVSEQQNLRLFREMAVRHMYASMLYRLCEFVVTEQSVDVGFSPKDRNADYFKQLIALLREHYRTERSVEFYAAQMNLTPKHLSRVVRSYSGKSVHQWIDQFVVLEIKNLLKYSDMSIQQISYELNFPNPSFMGQYFKRIAGMTPGEYRREL